MKRFGFLVMLIVVGMLLIGCNGGDKEVDKKEPGAAANDKDNEKNNEKNNGNDEGNETENNSSELSGEITVWAHPFTGEGDAESEMWKDIIASFEEDTGVKVTFEQIPWANRDQKILTALVANSGPDVFYVIPDQMPQYADEGMLLDLSPYLEDHDMDDFVDTALTSVTWKDKVYALPILQEAYTLFYNAEIVEAIGESTDNLPTTWEEFEDWAAKARDKGFYATSFQGGGSMNGTLYPYLWQAGGDVVTEDNEVLLNNDAGVEAFELINKMYENKWIPEDSITAMEHNSLWDGGKLMTVTGSGSSISRMLEMDLFEVVIAPPLKHKEQLTYGTTGMFVAPTITKNPDAAAEFIKVMTNSENQKSFNAVTQYVPTRESAKGIFDDNPYLAQIASYTEFALPGVIHPAGRSIMPFIQAELQTMMEGNKTPKEAADAAAEAIEAELNK